MHTHRRLPVHDDAEAHADPVHLGYRGASLATSSFGSIENNGTPARTSRGVVMARCYARATKRRSLGFWPPGAELVFSSARIIAPDPQPSPGTREGGVARARPGRSQSVTPGAGGSLRPVR